MNNPALRVLCCLNDNIEVLQRAAGRITAKLLSKLLACFENPREAVLDETTVIGMRHLEKLLRRRGSGRRVTVEQSEHLLRPRDRSRGQIHFPAAEPGALLGGAELCFAFAKLFVGAFALTD